MNKKKIPKEISEHYRKLAQKSVKARHAKILENITTQEKESVK